MADAPNRQELLTALTTEHFTLQGARSQTASESASRASLFILSVSSSLVALGFIGQTGQTFHVFALTVLPTLYVVGVFTFVRVVECGAEDFRYGVAINRIRHYYKEIAGDRADLFLLSGHDDGQGVFANAAVPVEGRACLADRAAPARGPPAGAASRRHRGDLPHASGALTRSDQQRF